MKDWLYKNRYEIIIYILLVIGFAVRLINIQNLPNGLNVDEASSGYEAYAISNYGIDRNGNSVPVFLLSWGSGQNALYTYMIIPFVKLFGLSVLTTRLPMAILGCISLVIMYKLLSMLGNKKLAIIGLAFLAINPWHIMKSRWGLESNVFPDLVLIAVYLIIYALKHEKNSILYLGFGVLGLCAYSYGTAYFFMPLFVLPLLVYFVIKKKITIKVAIICLAIVFIISLPIILYVFINTFDLPQLKILCFTIPRMTTNRYKELSSLFSKDFLSVSLNNFKESIKILLLQTDNSGWNSILPYGITYLFSLPFTIIGIIQNFKNNKEEKVLKNIINIWFIASFLLLFAVDPNINRINIIMIPLIYYTIVGIFEIVNTTKRVYILVIALYFISFTMFMNTYLHINSDEYLVFVDGIAETIEYVDRIQAEEVYVQYIHKEPYIYTLFYTKTNPNNYISTVQYFRENGSFDNVKAFGKYKYYLPEEIKPQENVVYVLDKNNNLDLDYTQWKTTYFEKFVVLENK